jgi:hypothetical protein
MANLHLRSQAHTAAEMEAMTGLPPTNRFVPPPTVASHPEAYFGLRYASPRNDDPGATVEEKVVALLDLLEPHREVITAIGRTHGTARPPNFFVRRFTDRPDSFSWSCAPETLRRLTAFGFVLDVEVVPPGPDAGAAVTLAAARATRINCDRGVPRPSRPKRRRYPVPGSLIADQTSPAAGE